VIGIDRFGASAPARVLFEKFGFTSDNIAARAKKLLKKIVRKISLRPSLPKRRKILPLLKGG